MIAEACLLFRGWRPRDVLEMSAPLFFQMLVKGRMVDRRQRFAHYYEMCRVAAYPTYTDESKNELSQYYYESSLTSYQQADRDRLREQMEREAQKNYQAPSVALDFFKTQLRGVR